MTNQTSGLPARSATATKSPASIPKYVKSIRYSIHAQRWAEHFRWSEDRIRVLGITPVGRATVIALHLSDDPDALEVRSYWVLVGWHPPRD